MFITGRLYLKNYTPQNDIDPVSKKGGIAYYAKYLGIVLKLFGIATSIKEDGKVYYVNKKSWEKWKKRHPNYQNSENQKPAILTSNKFGDNLQKPVASDKATPIASERKEPPQKEFVPKEPESLDLEKEIIDEKTLTEVAKIFSLNLLKFPISNGMFFLLLGNSTHSIETEAVPLTKALHNEKALASWLINNSKLLKKIENSNASVPYSGTAMLISSLNRPGLSTSYFTFFEATNYKLKANEHARDDKIANIKLKDYINFRLLSTIKTLVTNFNREDINKTKTQSDNKDPSFKVNMTEAELEKILKKEGIDIEETLKKGGIDIHEVEIKTDSDKDEDDLFEEFCRQFLGEQSIASQLKEEINSDIEKLSPAPSDLPTHLKDVYEKLSTKNPNYKALFNLNDRYSTEDVQQAGKKIAMKLHPDKNLSHPVIAKELFSIMAKIKVLLEQEAANL